ncbi:MAG: TIR domain-containing protein [Anaerolineales bacterium]
MGMFDKRRQVPATIVRIWEQAPPGAPWYYWIYVMFESRGERIKIHLKKRQAKKFVDQYSEGDTGYLDFKGDRMYDWTLATADQPIGKPSDIKVFISYSHDWTEDAKYIAQVFETNNLQVWLDENQLRVGDKLNKEIINGIKNADYFIALLSSEYFSSPWCIKEFELAIEKGLKFIPIKVSVEALVLPPHLKRVFEQDLGNPIFLDIRKTNPAEKLREIAYQMQESS